MPSPQFFLYGASPSELAQQQQNYTQLFSNAAESNANRAQAANTTSLQAFLDSQRADDAARTVEARNRIAMFENQQQLAAQTAANTENNRRFNVDLGLKLREMNQKDRYNQQYGYPAVQAETDLRKAQAKSTQEQGSTALKTLQFSHERAQQDAANGNISSVADALKLYHGLTTDDAQHYFDQSQQSRQDIEGQVGQIESAAKTLNAYEDAKRKLVEAKKVDTKSDRFRWGHPAADAQAAEVEKYTSTVASLEPIIKALQKQNSGILNNIDFDPDTGKYTAVLPKLPWLKKSTAAPAAIMPATTATATTNPGSSIPTTGTGTDVAAQKLQMANQLRASFPNWTKQQIIDEVNLQFSGQGK